MTTSSELVAFFEERFDEVNAHLVFLEGVERAAQSGPPKIEGSEARVTVDQQRILYSGLYLLLYNLVEATISRCLSAVTAAASIEGKWKPQDLNASLQSEWIRVSARTHVVLTPDHRLESAIAMCAFLIDQLPLADFEVEAGGGGNWDDIGIEKMSARLGCGLSISKKAKAAAKRPVRDDMGALALIKNRRNLLAHGSISFVECADGVTVDDLRFLVDAVGLYLREALDSFVRYIDEYEFLRPESMPVVQA